MRTITISTASDTGKPSTYSVIFSTGINHDVGVKPLLTVGVARTEARPNRTAEARSVLVIWPTGIKLGKHVFRAGYLCEGSNAADDATTTKWHPGPWQAALDYFHGLFGPKWPVKLDGVPGYFTAVSTTTVSENEPVFEVVEFCRGDVPVGTEENEEVEADSAAKLVADMVVLWGRETKVDIAVWQSRANLLGVDFVGISAEASRKAYGKGGPLHRETMQGEAPATPPDPGALEFERIAGPQLRARLKVKLISKFGNGNGSTKMWEAWLREQGLTEHMVHCGKRLVMCVPGDMTAREAEWLLGLLNGRKLPPVGVKG